MKVFYGIDDNFAQLVCASIASVLEHTQDVEIVILHKGINPKPFECFGNVSFYEVPDEWIELFSKCRKGERYTLATFYRLIIPFICDDGLYIDGDCIVETDVVEYCKPYKTYTAFKEPKYGLHLTGFNLFRNIDREKYREELLCQLNLKRFDDFLILNNIFKKLEVFPEQDWCSTQVYTQLRSDDIEEQLAYSELYRERYNTAKVFHYSMMPKDLETPRLYSDGGMKFWYYWLKYKLRKKQHEVNKECKPCNLSKLKQS